GRHQIGAEPSAQAFEPQVWSLRNRWPRPDGRPTLPLQIKKGGDQDMAISLYDVSVASFLQTLGGVAGFLERGLAHCQDNNIDPQEIVQARMCPDMLDFRFQIISVAHHSLGAIEGVKAGVFSPGG